MGSHKDTYDINIKKHVYYELAAPVYKKNYEPLVFQILADSLNIPLNEVQNQVKPTPENLSNEMTVIYTLFLLGPRMDDKDKWTRLGEIIESGANLVICLFRCATEVPLKPLILKINPPYVRDERRNHPLNMIEFMVNTQKHLLKVENFSQQYLDSMGKKRKEIATINKDDQASCLRWRDVLMR